MGLEIIYIDGSVNEIYKDKDMKNNKMFLDMLEDRLNNNCKFIYFNDIPLYLNKAEIKKIKVKGGNDNERNK